jgi:hypothetical protein
MSTKRRGARSAFIEQAKADLNRNQSTVAALPAPAAEADAEPKRLDPNNRDQIDAWLRESFGVGAHANHITPAGPHIADYVPLGADFNIAPAGAEPGVVQYVVTPRMCTHCGRVSVVFKGYPDQAQHGPFLVFEQPTAADLLHIPGR